MNQPQVKCRICHTAGDHVRFAASEMMYGTGDCFPYFQCIACDCIQIEKVPENLSQHYPSDYYSYDNQWSVRRWLVSARDRYVLTGRGMMGRLLAFKWAGTWVREFEERNFPGHGLQSMQIHQSSRILDVGCGSGRLLYMLHQNFGFRSLAGADPYLPKSTVIAPGVVAHKAHLHELDGPWDLIMFHHVFEHMAQQAETLSLVRRLLAPGGYCLIRVPVIGAAWRQYGSHWIQLDPPRHLFIHSEESIRRLARETGFTVDRVVYDSWAFQFWGSEQCRRGIPLLSKSSYSVNPGASMFSAEEIHEFERRASELNEQGQGDQAAFYLRARP